MSKCTWKGKVTGPCAKEAVHDQRAKDGEVWAQLCDEHEATLERNIQSGEPKQIIGSWIAAGGGYEAAAKRSMRDISG